MQTRAAVAAIVPVVLVILALFAVAAFPTVMADTGMPTWQKGNWWGYSLTNASVPNGRTGAGTLKIVVIAETTVTVAGVMYSTYDTMDWLNVSSGSVTYSIAGDTWFRTSDLSPVRAAFGYTTTYVGTTLSISITLTYAPPQEMVWPLTAGTAWSSTSIVSTTSLTTIDGSSTTNTTSASLGYQYTVQTADQVTIPKGTFSAMPVQQTELGVLGYTVTYWSGDVGNFVKQGFYDSNGNEQSTASLTDYSYTPPSRETVTFLGIAYSAWLVLIGMAVAFVIVAMILLRPKRLIPSPVPPNRAPSMQPVPPESSELEPPAKGGPPPPL